MEKSLSPTLPGLTGAFVLTKSPGAIKTYYVRLRFDAAQPPTALLQALASAGFQSSRPHVQEAHFAGQIEVIDFSKPGTGLFQAWTATEAEAALASLKDVFERFGLPFAPRRADAADLL